MHTRTPGIHELTLSGMHADCTCVRTACLHAHACVPRACKPVSCSELLTKVCRLGLEKGELGPHFGPPWQNYLYLEEK